MDFPPRVGRGHRDASLVLTVIAMSEPPPRITVVIPARPDQADIKAVAASQQLHYPADLLEIIVVRGIQPSIQRNAAIREARGELIYFLDDDSVPLPDNLRRAVPHFLRSEVQMVGGPALCPPESSALEQVFAMVMGSWLAFGPSRARYRPVGRLRETSEKELILCNLLARRSTLLASGGFDESLYPNEENALMDQIQSRGGRLLYDPEFVAYRRPRQTLRSFMKMLMTYGRGRAEQFRLHPTLGSALNFAPPLFLLYVLLTPLLPVLPRWCLWLWLVYGLALAVQAAALKGRSPLHKLFAIPLIFLSHLLYGFGFWRGLFTSLKRSNRAAAGVFLERIKGA
jgi:succinoglycan biosynthesis protein ExoA